MNIQDQFFLDFQLLCCILVSIFILILLFVDDENDFDY